MTTKLILCFHDHQPVGNFDFVIEEAYQKSYLPFIKLASDFPSIKFSIHFSGFLMDWISKAHPEYIEMLRSCVNAGQANIICGAYYEPILSNIPEKDALDQISLYKERLKGLFSEISDGIWLAERVWEPHFPSILSKAGINFTMLDEFHFQYAGVQKDDLHGYYLTEHLDSSQYVFPISKKLRYLMPYHKVNEVIEFLLKMDGRTITMADDGEKFGLWPGTYELVYERGWLKNLFEEININENIQTVHFKECLESEVPRSRIFLPCASYPEMMEWALQHDVLKEVLKLKTELPKEKQGFVKGGFWSNFSVKYPEINCMTKRMYYTSKRVREFDPKERTDLFKAQCNCAYWHGIFGGVYLPHLRHAVYEHLIRMEERIPKNGVFIEDILQKGSKSIIVKNDDLQCFFKQGGGSIFEIDLLKQKRNILSVMARKPEYYHDFIDMGDTSGIKTIHDGFYLKDGKVDIIYDVSERVSLLDIKYGKEPNIEDLYRSVSDISFYANAVYEQEIIHDKITFFFKDLIKKTIRINGNSIVVDNTKYTDNLIQQWNIAVSSINEKIVYDNSKELFAGELKDIWASSLKIFDSAFDIMLEFKMNEPVRFMIYPIKTVSNSESGAEEILQGISINIFINNGTYELKL